MRFAHHRFLTIPFFALTLTAAPLAASTDTPPTKDTAAVPAPAAIQAKPSATDLEVYPQIVRISLLEGDVRVSRGTKGAPWEQAQVNLPLEEGFNLVTGTGRAEIEFEDASTAYLGENSVLTFNTLTSTGGVPRTDITLVSGTLTVDEQTRVSGQRFVIHSPTETFGVSYPSRVYARFESYVDAMTVTPQREIRLYISSSLATLSSRTAETVAKGTSVTLRDGKTIPATPADADDSSASKSAAWDTWVTQRVLERDAALTAAMRESGLTAPVPGLAELRAKGKFFACAPYGTCWEPTGGWASQYVVNVNQLKGQNAAIQQAVNTQQARNQIGGGGAPILQDDVFPCSPGMIHSYAQRDPLTGQTRLVTLPNNLAGSWAVCHSGAWIHNQNGYAWVALQKKHHHCPVAWVKTNGKTGFVPIHPSDVAGKRPINLEHGIFVPTGKKDSEAELLPVTPDHSVKLRPEAPTRFSVEPSLKLAHADTPHLEAHPIASNSASTALAIHATNLRPTGTPISFDRSSQSIQLAHQVISGTHTATVVQHFGGSSSFSQSGGGGFSGAHSGFSSSHSGSSGSSGGVASHGSSGSSSSGASSSSASASSSASSGGGGSHK